MKEVYDIHCHYFNAQYAIMEFLSAKKNIFSGNYPHKNSKSAKQPENMKKLFAIEGAREFLEYIAKLVEVACNNCEDNHIFSRKSFGESALGKNGADFLVSPLMMDIYFALDNNYDEKDDALIGQKNKSCIDSAFVVEATEKADFLSFMDTTKSKILDIHRELFPESEKTSLASEIIDDLFKEVNDEFFPTESVRKSDSVQYEGIQMSPGYQKHMHDLEKLCQSENYKGKVFPFLAVDPRRRGIKKLIEMKVRKERGYFNGIKLYPPLGYLPTHPCLEDIFDHCVKAENDIPITVHCMGHGFDNLKNKNWVSSWDAEDCHEENFERVKGQKSRYYSDPQHWKKVLLQPKWKNLRVNFAHFGGPNEDHKGEINVEWMDAIVDLMKECPNVYADIACIKEANLIVKILEYAQNKDILKERLMFGTDYVMIMCDRELGGNLEKYYNLYAGLKENESNFLSLNARSFMNLPSECYG